MPRIIKSLGLVAGAIVVIATGASGAFFSDTETSTGNTFTAGAIDLLIDNESYYNGNVCAENPQAGIENPNEPYWIWRGIAPYPVPGTPCTTSFEPSNLEGLFFFNFRDLKPDDEGEDTISLHVQNDAWACMDLTLTSNDDNTSTEPELEDGDVLDDDGNALDGELAQNINFFWWADDGDNVYEEGEPQITPGVVPLSGLDAIFPIALADSGNNIWGEPVGTPLPAGTSYIAKAWCLGDLTLTPDIQDGGDQGKSPANNPGVLCDGTLLDNKTQTDSAELNIVFSAVQSRNNPNFLCNPPAPRLATLTVNKIITADSATIGVEDFELHINGPLEGTPVDQIVGDNIPVPNLQPGTYDVYEVINNAGIPPGTTFTTTFSNACDPITHDVNLTAGSSLVCNINNTEN